MKVTCLDSLTYYTAKIKALFVKKAGDTMTGDLEFQSLVDEYDVDPSANETYPKIIYKDKNGKQMASMYVQHYASGGFVLRLQAEKYDANDSRVGAREFLQFYANKDDGHMSFTVRGEGLSRLILQGKNNYSDIIFRTLNPGNWTSDNTQVDAYIRSYDDGGGGNGRNLVIFSGGNTIIGGGESPASAYSALGNTDMPSAGNEDLVLTADGAIRLFSNANTWGNRGYVLIDSSGNLMILGRKYMSSPDRASLIIQHPVMQATTAAQNGLTANQYNEVFFRDKNSAWLGTVSQSTLYDSNNGSSGGASRVFLQSRMMKTNGDWATNHFSVYTYKDGSAHYGCGNAANFRSDLGLNNAANITTGTFSADRIPSLNASKITAGTLGADRIPTLSTSKISGLGTFKSANKTGLSVAANVDTITTGPSLSLEAGSWYVMAMGTFQSNTGAGARLCQTAIGNTATGGQYNGRQRVYNAGGNYEMVIANAFVVVSATTTVYGQISCSTSVSNNSCWIGAIRIK